MTAAKRYGVKGGKGDEVIFHNDQHVGILISNGMILGQVTKSSVDDITNQPPEKLRALEEELGLPPGYYDSEEMQEMNKEYAATLETIEVDGIGPVTTERYHAPVSLKKFVEVYPKHRGKKLHEIIGLKGSDEVLMPVLLAVKNHPELLQPLLQCQKEIEQAQRGTKEDEITDITPKPPKKEEGQSR